MTMAIEPIWMGELVRGAGACAVFVVAFLAAQKVWSGGDGDGRGADSGMD
jgi:hypothetical protein